jgi:GDP-L-fucose synthase
MSGKINKESKIYIAGHRGLVGTALLECFKAAGYNNLVYRTSQELDLTRQNDVEAFLNQEKPDAIILNAAIAGNSVSLRTIPTRLLAGNALIILNVLLAAEKLGISKIIFTSSATIYPDDAVSVSDGTNEYVNETEARPGRINNESDRCYIFPKLIGMEMCRLMNINKNISCVMIIPCHIWGKHYAYNEPNRLSVIPMLIQRFHDAVVNDKPEVVIWGTGNLRRELLHSEDLAKAYIKLMEDDNAAGMYNAGYGSYISIREIAEAIKSVAGYKGAIVFDPTKPEATELRLLASDKLRAMGWQPEISFQAGIRAVYDHYVKEFT